MAVPGALTGQVLAVLGTRRDAQRPRLWPLVAGGLCGLPLGLWLLPRLDGPTFQLAVGSLLSAEAFRRVVLALLDCSTVALLLRSVSVVAQRWN